MRWSGEGRVMPGNQPADRPDGRRMGDKAAAWGLQQDKSLRRAKRLRLYTIHPAATPKLQSCPPAVRAIPLAAAECQRPDRARLRCHVFSPRRLVAKGTGAMQIPSLRRQQLRVPGQVKPRTAPAAAARLSILIIRLLTEPRRRPLGLPLAETKADAASTPRRRKAAAADPDAAQSRGPVGQAPSHAFEDRSAAPRRSKRGLENGGAANRIRCLQSGESSA